MRTLFITLLLSLPHWCLSAVDPQSLQSFASVPPQVKLAFTHFCMGRYQPLFANNEKGFDDLAAAPGLMPALIELAEKLEIQQEWDGFTRTWALIGRRVDASQEEQEYVYRRLENLLDTRAGPRVVIKNAGLDFLGHYPSKRHENLLIEYLSDTKGKGSIFGIEDAAASLGKIGTAASIEPLKDYIRRHTPPPGAKWRSHDIATAALEQVQARLEAQQQRQATTQMKKSTPPQKKTGADGAMAHTESTDDMPWSVLALMVFAALGLLWLLVQGGIKARR